MTEERNQNLDFDQDQDLDGGKRRTRGKRMTKRAKKDVLVVGKIYANWCGHCQALKPEWAKMRKMIKSRCKGKRIHFVEIEESEMATKIPKFKRQYNVEPAANGYPALFKLEKGRLSYYQNSREADRMADWYLNGGGDPDQNQNQNQNQGPAMPRLFADLQGGKRSTRRVSNKPGAAKKKGCGAGFLDFLFRK